MDNEERLLVPRYPTSDWVEVQLEKHQVGDTYEEHFSTTSPPAFVYNLYKVTRKDQKGLWGVLIDSSVKEMTIGEV